MGKIKTKQKTLEFRRIKLLKNMPKSQKRAYRIVRGIAQKTYKFKIDQEKIFAPYIVDIYIENPNIAIEIDGSVHDETSGYDDRRDKFLLEKYKVHVVRFRNEEIETDYFKKCIWQICFRHFCKHVNNVLLKSKKNGVLYSFKDNKLKDDFGV
jgi:very-short-patch-repair endonuclease